MAPCLRYYCSSIILIVCRNKPVCFNLISSIGKKLKNFPTFLLSKRCYYMLLTDVTYNLMKNSYHKINKHVISFSSRQEETEGRPHHSLQLFHKSRYCSLHHCSVVTSQELWEQHKTVLGSLGWILGKYPPITYLGTGIGYPGKWTQPQA